MTAVLGIDAGTTRVTAVVASDDGAVVASASEEIALAFPRPGWVEQDPVEIWETVVRCGRAVIADGGHISRDVSVLGVTNQRETAVLWERSSGMPVAPAIVWQDRRTAPRCAELRRSGAATVIADRTGLVVDPYFSATKVEWLLARDPELARRAARGELCAGTVDSWLLWNLTGGVHATEASNASRTMYLDIATLAYDEDLLRTFHTPRELLPDVLPSGSVFGEVDPEVFGLPGIVVAGILGDQQASLFGQGCRAAGQAKNTYGTGSFVLAHTGRDPLAERGRLVATVARGLHDGAEYALEGSMFTTGASVQWLRDVGVISDARESELLAASVPDNGDVWFVPALSGLGAPYWDPAARGTLFGLTRGTTRAHLARAELESIAWRTRDVLEEVAAQGIPVTELRADGGAAANAWLMQFQADAVGIPVDVAQMTETTSLGAVYLAGQTAGVWRDDELARLRTSGQRYEPRWSVARRDEAYARWTSAVARSRQWQAVGD